MAGFGKWTSLFAKHRPGRQLLCVDTKSQGLVHKVYLSRGGDTLYLETKSSEDAALVYGTLKTAQTVFRGDDYENHQIDRLEQNDCKVSLVLDKDASPRETFLLFLEQLSGFYGSGKKPYLSTDMANKIDSQLPSSSPSEQCTIL